MPNPGTFDIPEDGTKLLPSGAPIFFPDPLRGDKLTRTTAPLPSTVTSQHRESGDPAQDAYDHIKENDPERIEELGFNSPDDFKRWIDDLMTGGASEIWERVPNPAQPNDKDVAYVDGRTGRFIIDNPSQPTAFRRDDYKDYLTRDAFQRVE